MPGGPDEPTGPFGPGKPEVKIKKKVFINIFFEKIISYLVRLQHLSLPEHLQNIAM